MHSTMVGGAKRSTSGAAIAQDWFFAPGGAEQAGMEISRLLPGAPIYTTFADPSTQGMLGTRLRTWALQRVFGPTRRFRTLLPLYPLYFERLDLRRFSLVVSSSVAFAHAIRTSAEAVHVSYVYTPVRYAWDLDAYLEASSFSRQSRLGARLIRGWLQRWDRSTANRPDVLVAISETVRQRIRDVWGRDAEIIYPPVAVDEIEASSRDDGYLLTAARMLAYRRIDIAVEAATKLGRELVVIGDGPERRRLEDLAGPTVHFLGRVSRVDLLDTMSRCHAYLVPGIEDFGIAPVEAMAAGKPVIGINAGGVAETVVDGTTGLLFDRQNWRSLADTVERLDATVLDAKVIRARAETFATPRFHERWRELFRRLGVDPSLYSGG
jgi:glycosyltransferase involved in cell wall biosynthesis